MTPEARFVGEKELDVARRLACSSRASAVTLQLFEVRQSRQIRTPMTLGTGVFAQYEGQDMVLTASHVLDSEHVQRFGLYVGHRVHGFLDLGDFSFIRTGSEADRLTDDDLDVAAILLEPEIANRLRDGGVFESVTLPSSDLPEASVLPYVHFIHGFPVNLSATSRKGQHLEPTSISCFLPLHDEANGSWETRFSDSKIDFEYVPRTVIDLDGLDRRLPLPEPHGFSGCGVWQVSFRDDSAPQMRLVGIVHRFNRAIGVLRATRLDLLYAMLKQAT